MPVYEYVCVSCGDRFDLLRRHADADAPAPCPICDEASRRAFSRVAVKLEGWGFSRTDGMVPDRPGRGDYKEVAARADRIAEGG